MLSHSPVFRATAAIIAILVAGFGIVYEFLQSVDWSAVAKTWGPMGIVFVIAMVLLVGGAKFGKALLTDTVADARKERDAQRALLEKQATEFVNALKDANELHRDEMKDVTDTLDRMRRR